MKKLTPERRAILEPAIAQARPALTKASALNSMTPEWRTQMRIVWDAERLLQDTIGLAMTKSWAVMRDGVELDSFFEADGTPKKGR